MPDSKTGAVICKKPIMGSYDHEYEALAFIRDVPHDMDDYSLQLLMKDTIEGMDLHECTEILVRSNINATSNEVWEQYNNLNGDAGKGKVLEFSEIVSKKS